MNEKAGRRGKKKTHLLLNLQSVNDGGQLGQDLIGPLVVFELGGNQIRQVAERLGGVQDLEIG